MTARKTQTGASDRPGVKSDIDRPAAIRRALRDLVADNGFHGTSMNAIARAAGVAAGTAYVHYESKEELVYATYIEVKRQLGDAVTAKLNRAADPYTRYQQIWMAAHRHLRGDPARARFLMQLEVSPYYEEAFRRLLEQGDPLHEEAARPDVAELLVDLPTEAIYALSLGVAVRLVASGVELSRTQLDALVEATWRAITIP